MTTAEVTPPSDTERKTNGNQRRRNRPRGNKKQGDGKAPTVEDDPKPNSLTNGPSPEDSKTLPGAEKKSQKNKNPRGRRGKNDGRVAPTTTIEKPTENGEKPTENGEKPTENGGVVESTDKNENDDDKKESVPGSQKQRKKRKGKPARNNNKRETKESGDSTQKSNSAPPSLRIQMGSPTDQVYKKTFAHDDVVIVPEMFGKEDDWNMYETLVSEIKDLPNETVKTPWHQGSHVIVKDTNASKTFQEIIDKLCEYFHVKKDSIDTELNWYQDSKDWKQFEHDSRVVNEKGAEKHNMTIAVSFGACRELALLQATSASKDNKSKGEDACRICFPQPNNGVFTVGRDVSARFKQGINALPETEQDGKGRINIILWGWSTTGTEEVEPSTVVGDSVQGAGTEKKTLTKKEQKRREQRKAWRRKKIEEQRAAKSTKSAAAEGEATIEVDGETIDA